MSKDIEMAEHVARLNESGLTVWVYCLQNGIAYHSMQYWIKKVRRQNSVPLRQKKGMFIELSSSKKEDFRSRVCGFADQPPAPAQVELAFPGGLILKIYG